MVKVCGLTRPEDVILAAELGAWAVGFVLAPSPRRVAPEQAGALAAAARSAGERHSSGCPPKTVGVFVDAPAEVIAEVVAVTGLDGVQLHGPAPGAAAVRAALGEEAGDVFIIQAVPVPSTGMGAADLRAAVARALVGADLLLFDTRATGRSGGTGIPFPWGLAREAAGGAPFLVAGGLGPQNVVQAAAASGAVGVDVSSGVESAPGVKDPGLLRALFAAVRGGAPHEAGGREAPPRSNEGPSEGKGS